MSRKRLIQFLGILVLLGGLFSLIHWLNSNPTMWKHSDAKVAPMQIEEGKIKVVDIIPIAQSNETNQDSEPFLAVHPDHPEIMVASALTPSELANGTTPIYVTEDSGASWTIKSITPATTRTCDVTHAISAARGHRYGDLYAGAIACLNDSVRFDEAETDDVRSDDPMTVHESDEEQDQPFVYAVTIKSSDFVYVGISDKRSHTRGRTAVVLVSSDGGIHFKTVPIEYRPTAIQDGPSVRVSAASDGTVYAGFIGWRKFTGSMATADVVVLRDDAGGVGAKAFEALIDPADRIPGLRVATSRQIPWLPMTAALGQERIGCTLALAVDPHNSSTVYIGWGDQVGGGDIYTLHVRKSVDRGMTWTSDLPNTTIINATNLALAVGATGVVAMLYQQFDHTDGLTDDMDRWTTHLKQSPDSFSTVVDSILASVPASFPKRKTFPYLGDYDHLIAVKQEFRGIFSANNALSPPGQNYFPNGVAYQRRIDKARVSLINGANATVDSSIDPFYFSVPMVRLSPSAASVH